MSDVFYLRPIDPPISPGDVHRMAQHAGGCFDLHRVDWKQSFLAADGGRMLCWYVAPDAESARLALRQLGSNMNAVWPGRVIGEGAEPSYPRPTWWQRSDRISPSLKIGSCHVFRHSNGKRSRC